MIVLLSLLPSFFKRRRERERELKRALFLSFFLLTPPVVGLQCNVHLYIYLLGKYLRERNGERENNTNNTSALFVRQRRTPLQRDDFLYALATIIYAMRRICVKKRRNFTRTTTNTVFLSSPFLFSQNYCLFFAAKRKNFIVRSLVYEILCKKGRKKQRMGGAEHPERTRSLVSLSPTLLLRGE